MQRLLATFASTRLDREGEIIDRAALEMMAESIGSEYVTFGLMHDPRIPPIGRIASARLVELADGEWAVQGEIECWDAEDSPEQLRGDGRTLSPPKEPIGRFSIGFDRHAEQELGVEYFSELASLAGSD